MVYTLPHAQHDIEYIEKCRLPPCFVYITLNIAGDRVNIYNYKG